MRITKNNLKDVYKSPKCSIETMELRGYELIDNLFVDSSGFGADDEPALTANQFDKKLAEIVSQHGTVHTAITDSGQFQVYVGIFKHTGKKRTRKIDNNTWEVLDNDGNVIAIRLHDTNIITYQGHKVTLDSGGWQTMTTKARLNRYLPDGVSISQKNFDWFVHDTRDNTVKPFTDGMTIAS